MAKGTVKGYSKRATGFATLPQSGLKSNVARFTTHFQTYLATNHVANCVNTDF